MSNKLKVTKRDIEQYEADLADWLDKVGFTMKRLNCDREYAVDELKRDNVHAPDLGDY